MMGRFCVERGGHSRGDYPNAIKHIQMGLTNQNLVDIYGVQTTAISNKLLSHF